MSGINIHTSCGEDEHLLRNMASSRAHRKLDSWCPRPPQRTQCFPGQSTPEPQYKYRILSPPPIFVPRPGSTRGATPRNQKPKLMKHIATTSSTVRRKTRWSLPVEWVPNCAATSGLLGSGERAATVDVMWSALALLWHAMALSAIPVAFNSSSELPSYSHIVRGRWGGFPKTVRLKESFPFVDLTNPKASRF
jgi:hypothetical protein